MVVVIEQEVTLMGMFGMFITIVGVVVVSLEGTESKNKNSKRTKLANMEKVCESDSIELIEDSFSSPESSSSYTPPHEEEEEEEDEEETNQINLTFLEIHFASDHSRGYLLAVLNVGLDCLGSVLTKMHGEDFSTWEINLIRFGSAAVVMGAMAGTGKLIHDQCAAWSGGASGSSPLPAWDGMTADEASAGVLSLLPILQTCKF
jgi:hypothetical protein